MTIKNAELDALALAQVQIFNLMQSKGMNQKALAKALKVSESHVSQLLHGEPRNMSIKKLAKICYLLDDRLEITTQTLMAMEKAAEEASLEKQRAHVLLTGEHPTNHVRTAALASNWVIHVGESLQPGSSASWKAETQTANSGTESQSDLCYAV